MCVCECESVCASERVSVQQPGETKDEELSVPKAAPFYSNGRSARRSSLQHGTARWAGLPGGGGGDWEVIGTLADGAINMC